MCSSTVIRGWQLSGLNRLSKQRTPVRRVFASGFKTVRGGCMEGARESQAFGGSTSDVRHRCKSAN